MPEEQTYRQRCIPIPTELKFGEATFSKAEYDITLSHLLGGESQMPTCSISITARKHGIIPYLSRIAYRIWHKDVLHNRGWVKVHFDKVTITS